jgi:hypothetical protein
VKPPFRCSTGSAAVAIRVSRLPHAITRARCQRRECVLEAGLPNLKAEFNGIGAVANLHQHRADGRHLKNGQSNARGSSPYRRWRRSDCACSGLFALGATGTQMTPHTRASSLDASRS